MKHGILRAGIPTAAGLAILTAAGCGSPAPRWVGASDPVLGVCQQPVVQSLDSLAQAVDDANNTNPAAVSGQGQKLTLAQIASLRVAAGTLQKDAALLTSDGEHGLVTSMLSEANEFQVVTSSQNRLTTNTLARAVDGYTSQIDGVCRSLRVGTPPPAARPGPGIWDWRLFGEVLAGYGIMIFACSYMIAVAERRRQRHDRLEPGAIFGLALLWPFVIFLYAGRWWGEVLTSARTPADEKDAARRQQLIDATSKAQADLELANERIRQLEDGS